MIIAAAFVFLMAGCNLKEKISDKISEQMIESTIGEDADVEINGDDVSYTTEDGEMTVDESGMTYEGEDGTVIASGGEYEWPLDQAAAYLPKLECGTITYIANGPDTCMLLVESLVLEDYQSYKEAVIAAGYTKDPLDSSAEDMELYSGASTNQIIVTLSFVPSEGSIQISVDASDILQ